MMMPDDTQKMQIGIIGMGLMGKMYARRLSEAGWQINACDVRSKYESLTREFADHSKVTIMEDGHLVSRISDWIIYMVEAENIHRVVEMYGRSTKANAIVGGQTSCKAPEITAFERHLPADVDIVSCHSMHGPNVDPTGQPLIIIPHRDNSANMSSTTKVERVLSCLNSTQVRLSAEQHDRITADTQAVTHAAFLSMGAAWRANRQFPWETSRYLGGIENIKINITLRIYSNQWHVYAGLAILNPAARKQIKQYAESVTELFKLMLEGDREELTRRVHTAGEAVFGKHRDVEPLLEDAVLDRFTIGAAPHSSSSPSRDSESSASPARLIRNNHLSLLAIVDCWSKLGIVPYDHMICSTPLFRLWLGATEYLYRTPRMLQDAIDTAIEDTTYRSDDLEFTFAARDWSQRVSLGNMDAYREKFVDIQSYFKPRFPEAQRVGNEMITTILSSANERAEARRIIETTVNGRGSANGNGNRHSNGAHA